MTTATTTSVRVSQRIRATPERLFRAWTDPKELANWWRMDGPGWSFAGASINDVGNDVTEVILTHERFADSSRAPGHESGWTQLLRLLHRAMQEAAA